MLLKYILKNGAELIISKIKKKQDFFKHSFVLAEKEQAKPQTVSLPSQAAIHKQNVHAFALSANCQNFPYLISFCPAVF